MTIMVMMIIRMTMVMIMTMIIMMMMIMVTMISFPNFVNEKQTFKPIHTISVRILSQRVNCTR